MYANCPSMPLQKYMYLMGLSNKQISFMWGHLQRKAQNSGIKIQISLGIQFSMHLNSTQFDTI